MSSHIAERYWIITLASTYIYTCRECGSLTTDPMLHDKWHAALAAALASPLQTENGEQK